MLSFRGVLDSLSVSFLASALIAERGARYARQTFILHPDVPHVPHEPQGQADEQDQRAGWDEEIPVKHAAHPHVTEYPDEQQDHTEDVEDDRHYE